MFYIYNMPAATFVASVVYQEVAAPSPVYSSPTIGLFQWLELYFLYLNFFKISIGKFGLYHKPY